MSNGWTAANPWDDAIVNAYHDCYVRRGVHDDTKFLGVAARKYVGDLWSYQEVIWELKPALIVEAGVWAGGSALWFAEVAALAGLDCHVLAIDPDQEHLAESVIAHPRIEHMAMSSVDEKVAARICALRKEKPGPMLVSLDSDHRMQYVLHELRFFRDLTQPGDYVVVEDGNINGHPVMPTWGPGPWEALEQYMAKYPDDYERDMEREEKFGMTYAPRGWLRRR